MVAHDELIGVILAKLDDLGIADDTLVMYSTDNGPHFNSWPDAAITPFRSEKNTNWEGGWRVPIFVRWPGKIKAGSVFNDIASHQDWLPTLLAAAGTGPDSDFPSDGMDLLPVLARNAAAVPRKLFWRYKANAQRAARDADYKYLKILDNTFLFNVVEDPMERANLKQRRRDLYAKLVTEWFEWNATMLPEIDESNTGSFTGEELADHIGAKRTSSKADNPAAPEATTEGPR